MDRISVGQAIGAGFRLIGREPMAFLAWCGVCFVVSALPQALIVGSMVPMFETLASSAGKGLDPALLDAQAQINRFQGLSYLSSLLLLLVLPAAIFRAVLEPEDRASFYLRIGAREGWTWLVTLVLVVMSVIAMVVAAIPIGIVAAIGAAVGGGGGGATAFGAVLLLIPAFGVLIWAVLRFSMAPVMAFSDRTFRLTESWAFTRTHASSLFLVALGLFGLVALAELVLGGVGLGVVLSSRAKLQAAFAHPADLLRGFGMVWVPLALVAWSVLVAANNVLWMAAWADVYRQLRPQLAETFA